MYCYLNLANDLANDESHNNQQVNFSTFLRLTPFIKKWFMPDLIAVISLWPKRLCHVWIKLSTGDDTFLVQFSSSILNKFDISLAICCSFFPFKIQHDFLLKITINPSKTNFFTDIKLSYRLGTYKTFVKCSLQL